VVSLTPPIAFLLDPAHGWEMTDYPQWPFEVSQINRSDRALRELFGAAYYPGPVREGEPASGERQAFVARCLRKYFDVLVSSGTGVSPAERHAQDARATPINAIDPYRAIIVGGEITWIPAWTSKLQEYVSQWRHSCVEFSASERSAGPISLVFASPRDW